MYMQKFRYISVQIKTNSNLHVSFNINFVDAKESLTDVFQKHMYAKLHLNRILYFIAT